MKTEILKIKGSWEEVVDDCVRTETAGGPVVENFRLCEVVM